MIIDPMNLESEQFYNTPNPTCAMHAMKEATYKSKSLHKNLKLIYLKFLIN